MFRKIALVLNWSALSVLVIALGGLFRFNPNLVGPESLVPLLPYGAALASYHFPPKLPMVWTSLFLNGLFCLIGLLVVGASAFGITANPVLAALFGLLLFALPCGLNVRNMVRIRRNLRGSGRTHE